MRVRTIAAGLAILLVVAAIAMGLVMLGHPSEQRALRLDERRLASLRELRSAIDEYWRMHGRLPDTIGEPPILVEDKNDPVTGREYRYRVVTGTTYQLCADFERPTPPDTDPFWTHGVGTRCFDLEARAPGSP